MYISFVPSTLMKYTFFHFTRWNKSHIHDKHLNFLFIIYVISIEEMQSLSSTLMKYTFFHFTRWNKSHIHDKHLNFLFIIYVISIEEMQSLSSTLMKYTFFHFTRWNKSHIHSKHLNILYLSRIFLSSQSTAQVKLNQKQYWFYLLYIPYILLPQTISNKTFLCF